MTHSSVNYGLSFSASLMIGRTLIGRRKRNYSLTTAINGKVSCPSKNAASLLIERESLSPVRNHSSDLRRKSICFPLLTLLLFYLQNETSSDVIAIIHSTSSPLAIWINSSPFSFPTSCMILTLVTFKVNS